MTFLTGQVEKLPSFCRRYFQIDFPERKYILFKFTWTIILTFILKISHFCRWWFGATVGTSHCNQLWSKNKQINQACCCLPNSFANIIHELKYKYVGVIQLPATGGRWAKGWFDKQIVVSKWHICEVPFTDLDCEGFFSMEAINNTIMNK